MQTEIAYVWRRLTIRGWKCAGSPRALWRAALAMTMCKASSIAVLGVVLLGSSLAPATEVYIRVDKHGRVALADRQFAGAQRGELTRKGWVEKVLDSYGIPGVRGEGFNWKENQQRYDPFIRGLARRHGIPHTLLHAVITAESSYDPGAVSKAGAVGLMQLMPETAARYGVKNRTHPQENMRAGVHYLSDLLQLFKNDIKLALAAYNAGENTVIRYGNQIPPYQETQRYVKKVLEYYQRYEERKL